MLIGAVVRDFSDPFFAGAIEALAVEAMGHGYNIVLGHAQGRLDEGIALTTVLETRHTDAIVLLGDMQDQPRLLDDLRGSTVPVVAMWQGSSPLEFPTAEPDDRAGIRAGLTHLVDLGHTAYRLRERPPAGRLPAARGRLRRVHGRAPRRRPGRLPPAGARTRWPAARRRCAPCSTLPEPPTAVVHLDRPRRHRRPARRPRDRGDRPGSPVGRRLRRHPHRGPHGPGADDRCGCRSPAMVREAVGTAIDLARDPDAAA